MEEETDSNLIKETPEVTPKATSNTSMLGSNEDLDELKKAWEHWWTIYTLNKNIDNTDNKQKQLEAQIKFMALYEKEKQSKGETGDISQKPFEGNKSSGFSKTGGKSRKNKGKTKRKFRNVSSK